MSNSPNSDVFVALYSRSYIQHGDVIKRLDVKGVDISWDRSQWRWLFALWKIVYLSKNKPNDWIFSFHFQKGCLIANFNFKIDWSLSWNVDHTNLEKVHILTLHSLAVTQPFVNRITINFVCWHQLSNTFQLLENDEESQWHIPNISCMNCQESSGSLAICRRALIWSHPSLS